MSGSVTNFQLSKEQQEILDTCCPPTSERKPLVRVTAAAGTGKTTTLLLLSQQAAKLGHRHITYLTFNRSAAQDAVKRLRLHKEAQQNSSLLLNYGTVIDGRTLHSCARRLLRLEVNEDGDDRHHPSFVDDTEMEKLIAGHSKQQIEDFMSDWRAPNQPPRSRESWPEWERRHRERAVVQIIFFIRKSLVQFCRSKLSLDELKDHSTANRDYYPAKKYHKNDGYGPKLGFSPQQYTERRIKFYAEEAHRLFGLFQSQNILSHDLVMKRAQLNQCRIPGTSLLLVDESQDLDACQIDWAVQQHHLYGTHVYFVGDCAQSIYSFRGAKAKNLITIDGVTDDCNLTKSWRFGEYIARVANCALFCKEKSPHTPPLPPPDKDPQYQKWPNWSPYRVIGGAAHEGIVTTNSLLPQWKTMQITIIARSNVSLLEKAVAMLGVPTADEVEKEKQATNETDSNKDDDMEDSEEDVFHDALMEIPEMPKFCINGKGQSSGRNKWKRVLKEVRALADLFLAESSDGVSLDENLFPEFCGQKVTWESFAAEVDHRELSQYAATISVIEKFQQHTLKAIDMFEKEVMNKQYPESEADIILTTCHAAKGMEWNNVEICNDFTDVWDTVKLIGPRIRIESLKSSETASNLPVVTAPPSPTDDNRPEHHDRTAVIINPYKKQKMEKPIFRGKSYQFDCKPSQDDVNLIYVAITRAKQRLCISNDIWKFLQTCDFVHEWIQAEQKVKIIGSVMGAQIKEECDVENIYHDLILPLRKENNLITKQSIAETLVQQPCSTNSEDQACNTS